MSHEDDLHWFDFLGGRPRESVDVRNVKILKIRHRVPRLTDSRRGAKGSKHRCSLRCFRWRKEVASQSRLAVVAAIALLASLLDCSHLSRVNVEHGLVSHGAHHVMSVSTAALLAKSTEESISFLRLVGVYFLELAGFADPDAPARA